MERTIELFSKKFDNTETDDFIPFKWIFFPIGKFNKKFNFTKFDPLYLKKAYPDRRRIILNDNLDYLINTNTYISNNYSIQEMSNINPVYCNGSNNGMIVYDNLNQMLGGFKINYIQVGSKIASRIEYTCVGNKNKNETHLDLYKTSSQIKTNPPNGSILDLDNIQLKCFNGGAIHGFKYINESRDRFRYDYTCLRINITNEKDHYTKFYSGEFFKWNALTQKVDCGEGKVLTYLKPQKNEKNQMRWHYKCATPVDSVYLKELSIKGTMNFRLRSNRTNKYLSTHPGNNSIVSANNSDPESVHTHFNFLSLNGEDNRTRFIGFLRSPIKNNKHLEINNSNLYAYFNNYNKDKPQIIQLKIINLESLQCIIFNYNYKRTLQVYREDGSCRFENNCGPCEGPWEIFYIEQIE